ncbi:MAG: ATP-dependent 6-phosphofructokinase [Verrucomicrobiota bacterium JB025]|nr:ATP-dependent 6-phosphofructokinase [Verrucomicrobiota bacterium JB025]
MKTCNIDILGDPRFPSPLPMPIPENIRVPSSASWPDGKAPGDLLLFEMAGARKNLFFNPAETRAAIVTCGGLCPGLNNVIRSVTRELRRSYGVQSVLGIRGGYRGLDPSRGKPPIELTDDFVEDIHIKGGTDIETSRGPVDTNTAVDFLIEQQIDILFTVGGDGTQRGGRDLHQEAERRGHPLSVVGIPKTIDNDVRFVSRSFGFTTAVSEAVGVIDSAHTEAHSVNNGLSIIKLMGRNAGFIAAAATVASQEVNFCLIPELPFALAGPNGLLQALEKRLDLKHHAVIVVAEGAGQDLLDESNSTDASGNKKLQDIGTFLRDAITDHFNSRGIEMVMRYLDPGYQIRGCPANEEDSILCDRMARHAVHAAMSGRTGLVISYLNGQFVHVPIELITAGGKSGGKRIDLEGELWRGVLATTGQPLKFG